MTTAVRGWTLLMGLAAFAGALASGSAARAGDGRAAAGRPDGSREGAAEAYEALPLRFEANVGQADPDVRFLSRGAGHACYLTGAGAVLALRDRDDRGWSVLRMRLHGGIDRPDAVGLDRQPGNSSYFRGDRRSWRTGVPGYARVRFAGVYPGVDLVYYGSQRKLEYDFLVAPGADPDRIRLAFEGAREVSVDAKGDLVLETAAGPVRHERPVVYQEREGRRRTVKARYVLMGEQPGSGPDAARLVGFSLGEYDRSRPLVIDPKVLTYSTYLGGTIDDEACGVAVDRFGNAYVAGRTLAADFPMSGPVQGVHGGDEDAFVTKLNAAGCALVYSTFLGGGEDDRATAVTVDEDGRASVAGVTSSGDFPTTGGALQPAASGGTDGFVACLNAAGDGLVYSTYLGGPGPDEARGIAAGSGGTVYVVGATGSPSFPTTPGAFQTAYGGGNSDAFVCRLSSTGGALIYSTFLGGGPMPNKTPGDDYGNGIAVDEAGSAYVTGSTDAFDFPKRLPFQAGVDGVDAFVTKLDPSGSSLVFSSLLGGTGFDEGAGIDVDEDGHVYVAGTTGALTVPSAPESLVPFHGGATDAFAACIVPAGSRVLYYTLIGGRGTDGARGIAVDSAGTAYVVGCLNFPNLVGKRDLDFRSARGGDAFIAALDGSGEQSRFVLLSGGPNRKHLGDDCGKAVAVDPYDNVYAVGWSDSTDFPKGVIAPLRPVNVEHLDGFVVKLPSRPGARISVGPRRLRFSSVGGLPITRNLNVRNTGRKPVAVTVGVPGSPFSLGSGEKEFVLAPRAHRIIPVRFHPPGSPGIFTDEFQVVSTAHSRRACSRIRLSARSR